MSTFVTLLRVYLKFYFSTRRFIAILPFYVFASVLSPTLVITGTIPKSPDVYAWFQLGFLYFTSSAALVAGLLGGDALSQDFGRQGLFTLSQPIRRSVIMLARYTAAFIASAIIMVGVYDLIGAMFAQYIYGQLVPSAALIVAMSLLLTASMVAFVVLFSSLFKSPNISMIIAIVLIWVIMPLISSILALVHVEPWFLLTYAGNVLQALAQKTYPPNVQTVQISPASGLPTVTVYNPALLEATAIMLGYLVVSLLLAWIVYSRRELKETA